MRRRELMRLPTWYRLLWAVASMPAAYVILHSIWQDGIGMWSWHSDSNLHEVAACCYAFFCFLLFAFMPLEQHRTTSMATAKVCVFVFTSLGFAFGVIAFGCFGLFPLKPF